MITSWIRHPTILVGETVELRPLKEEYFSELIGLARDKRIWEFYTTGFADPTRFREILEEALTERDSGRQV